MATSPKLEQRQFHSEEDKTHLVLSHLAIREGSFILRVLIMYVSLHTFQGDDIFAYVKVLNDTIQVTGTTVYRQTAALGRQIEFILTEMLSISILLSINRDIGEKGISPTNLLSMLNFAAHFQSLPPDIQDVAKDLEFKLGRILCKFNRSLRRKRKGNSPPGSQRVLPPPGQVPSAHPSSIRPTSDKSGTAATILVSANPSGESASCHNSAPTSITLSTVCAYCHGEGHAMELV